MKTSSVKVRSQSNISSKQDIPMSFEEKGQAKLAAIFIDLYSDLTSAIIREYCANAMDSHNKAGQKEPIKVTLPTANEPTFKVKDYGMGMSLEDITDVYAKYGSSTKDMENDSIGSYGLGCKSALSISPSFTVVAIKDGQKTVAIVSREENSLGKISIVATVETDERNGVEISIPTSVSPREFAEKATKIFFTWPEGSVLVDGEFPTVTMHNKEHFMPLANNSFLRQYKDNGDRHRNLGTISPYNELVVNMGGIGYPVDYNTYNTVLDGANKQLPFSISFLRNRTWVISVPLGSVDLIPNREGLRWSPRSHKTVAEYLALSAKSLAKIVEERLDQADTRSDMLSDEVYRLVSDYSPILSGSVKWKGEKLPSDLSFEVLRGEHVDQIKDNMAFPTYRGKYTRKSSVYVMSLAFGFFTHQAIRNFGEFTSTDRTRNTTHTKWVFVKLNGANLGSSEAGALVNSYLKILDSPMKTTIVYVADKELAKNLWLRALIDDRRYDVQEIDLEQMQSEVTAFKRKVAKAARDKARGTDPIYPVLRYKDKNWAWVDMGLSEIEKYADTNPSADVYADETIFLTDNVEYYRHVTKFLKRTSLVVRMKGARNVASFVKKTSLNVQLDLEAAVSKKIEKTLGAISLRDYFIAVHMSHNFGRHLEHLEIENGFVKDVLHKIATARVNIAQSHTTYVIESFRGVLSKFPTIEAPESNVALKSKQIFETLPLLFEDEAPYGIVSRSDAYKISLANYVNAHTDTIESIVNS